jgi:hypothetical protein
VIQKAFTLQRVVVKTLPLLHHSFSHSSPQSSRRTGSTPILVGSRLRSTKYQCEP